MADPNIKQPMGENKPVIFVTDLNQNAAVFSFIFSLYELIKTEELLSLPHKSQIQVASRIFRIGIVSSVLYNYGHIKVKNESILVDEFLGSMLDSYFLLLRTLYDYLMETMNTHGYKFPKSFNTFRLNFAKSSYSVLKKHKKTLKTIFEWFHEIRSIRNSVKEGTSNFDIYLKNETYRVKGTWFDKENNIEKKVDTDLPQIIFNYSLLTAVSWRVIIENIRLSAKDTKN